MRFIKTSHRVDQCVWDTEKKKWYVIETVRLNLSMRGANYGQSFRNIKVTNIVAGESFDDCADVVVAARGTLNRPSWPDIEGFKTFRGKAMHSAEWDES
jgi:cation diffusion facilitator CzcD-associated flavoprotein CzcO